MRRIHAPESLPDIGEALPLIDRLFDKHGVLGILLVDLAVLGEIESACGADARRDALASFGAVVTEVARERLDVDDLIVRGETGRHEIWVLLFRQLNDARFFRQELPGFAQALRRALERRGNKVVYPYLRSLPELATGQAAVLRNPKLGTDTQLRQGVREARRDADLNARIVARERRRRMLELVLDRRVTSVYEPIVDVKNRTVFGYEALARGPEGTDLHSPMALFALAAQENLIFELDCLCRASGLEGAIDYPSGTKLFLNIRPTTLHDPNFRAERLIETLARCELQPSDVVFEISEQESIDNFDAFREIRDYYRGLGFQIALDDTGAGYAGLEALLEIEPEFIKVDRSFVSGVDQDPARQDMLRALQSVARKTGAQIVGEGLDTLEELEMLGELGFDFGQGWLFGKPTPLRARP
ncbi:MAG: EAL domain-containing protein [Proteobacteria bacterium]|nr:EAL domain-containing protein [Pseudomonadota bacterium]